MDLFFFTISVKYDTQITNEYWVLHAIVIFVWISEPIFK